MKKIVIIAAVAVVILITGIFVYKNYIREQNVFDQMYYTRVHKYFDWFNPGNPRGLFSNMKQLYPVGRDEEQTYTSGGYFFELYRPEYIKKGDRLQIDFYSNDIVPDGIYITYQTNWEHEESSRFYSYYYTLNDKTLLYSTNDPDNAKKKTFCMIFFSKIGLQRIRTKGFPLIILENLN